MPLPRFEATTDGAATGGMQEAYARDGFLIVDGFKSRGDCDAHRRRTHELVDAFDPASVTSVFEAGGDQRHAADRCFQESGDKIRSGVSELAAGGVCGGRVVRRGDH